MIDLAESRVRLSASGEEISGFGAPLRIATPIPVLASAVTLSGSAFGRSLTIGSVTASSFGINYDIGNSASLGFDCTAEVRAYGHRISNVHIKDRVLGGTTVPLGSGAANFPAVFSGLARVGYKGDFILQTARAADGDHLGALLRYKQMARDWIAASVV